MISKRIEEAEALAREAEVYGAGRNPGTRRFGVEVCAATSRSGEVLRPGDTTMC